MGEEKRNINSRNCYVVNDNTAIVTTQAGFRKFVKWWCNDNDFMGYLEGYPTSYPAIVKMSTGYRGYYYPIATCINASYISSMQKLLSMGIEKCKKFIDKKESK